MSARDRDLLGATYFMAQAAYFRATIGDDRDWVALIVFIAASASFFIAQWLFWGAVSRSAP